MPEETETDNSQNVEEAENPQTAEAEVVDVAEDELISKNRQLYERAKKAEQKAKELEEQLQLSHTESDPYSEDDLRKELTELKTKFTQMEEKTQLENLYTQYPVLKEKLVEFEEYRLANPGMNMQVGAKAFLAEHDLLGQTTKRKGLEKAGGGQRTPPTGKISVEDAKRLRENNYNEYRKMLMAGKIQF